MCRRHDEPDRTKNNNLRDSNLQDGIERRRLFRLHYFRHTWFTRRQPNWFCMFKHKFLHVFSPLKRKIIFHVESFRIYLIHIVWYHTWQIKWRRSGVIFHDLKSGLKVAILSFKKKWRRILEFSPNSTRIQKGRIAPPSISHSKRITFLIINYIH
jgi:hypothetical protein